MFSFEGTRKGHAPEYENKRSKPIGNNAKAIKKTDAPKRTKQQIKRMLKAYREQGIAGLASKHRGRKSNNCLSKELKNICLNPLPSGYRFCFFCTDKGIYTLSLFSCFHTSPKRLKTIRIGLKSYACVY
jgi:hypothetical protein